jgi:hypothetical protein
VAVPNLDDQQTAIIEKQLVEAGITERHDVQWSVNTDDVISALKGSNLKLSTMGRGLNQEEAFFKAAAAAGKAAANDI